MKRFVISLAAVLVVSTANAKIIKYEMEGFTTLGEAFVLRIALDTEDANLPTNRLETLASESDMEPEFMNIQFIMDGVDYFKGVTAAAMEDLRMLFQANGGMGYSTYEKGWSDVQMCDERDCSPQDIMTYQMFSRQTFSDFDMSTLVGRDSSPPFYWTKDSPSFNQRSYFDMYMLFDEAIFVPGDLFDSFAYQDHSPVESWGTISYNSGAKGCSEADIAMGCKPFLDGFSESWSREFSISTVRGGWTETPASEGALAPILGLLLWLGIRRRRWGRMGPSTPTLSGSVVIQTL